MGTPIYEPAEDSFMLLEQVEKFAKGIVLDMGTGSGIQAIAAAKRAERVVAADINPDALSAVEMECKMERITNLTTIRTDLFDDMPPQKFDLIIFNPPYLPDEDNLVDPALFGGKNGYEVVERFLMAAPDFLKDEGRILIVTSNFTDRGKVMEIIDHKLLKSRVLKNEHIFFEDLFVDLIEKTDLLKELGSKGITEVMYFTKGKRGVIYTGMLDGVKVAIKSKREDSKALMTSQKEASILKKTNAHGIGPRLMLSADSYIVYEFAEGSHIIPSLEVSSKKRIKEILMDLFRQMRKLDEIGINKYEMHHPIKHIIVGDEKIVLLDFERARHTENPKNVTQFCDFIVSDNILSILSKKGISIDRDRILSLSSSYKKDMEGAKGFDDIMSYIRSS